MKRTFDIFVSLAGLIAVSPLLLLTGLLVKLTSTGPILFVQTRIGRGLIPFALLKFRTMVPEAPKIGRLITVGEDPRITWIGRILRKTKIDELPQLLNVLKGDMSFVGPRPEVAKYVEMFRQDFQEILRVRPGITDLASIKFRDEASLLAKADDPERHYIERILPEKIRLAKEYVRQQSLWLDIKIILLTLWSLVADRLAHRSEEPAVRPILASVQSTHNSPKADNQ